jgi:methylmalonyl-CoA mutase N-terminal domain/subunit
MEAAAYEYFRKIDELGGMVAAVKDNFPQREIADAAFRYQSQLETGERVIVGVNVFEHSVDTVQPPTLVIDPDVEVEQAARLKQLRETRDNTSVATRLDALQEVARGSDNLMPAIIDCVRARATEGEIVEALRSVFGTYRETPVF